MRKIEIRNYITLIQSAAVKAPFARLGALFMAVLLVNGCKEVGPVVPWGTSHILSDTTYLESPQSPQTKFSLIEDVTGVSCTNCPASHVLLDTLISEYNIIGISYHVGSPMFNQDAPIVANPLQVMTSTDAQKIVGNQAFAYPDAGPIAMIDRNLFNNGNSYGSTLAQGGIWNLTAGWGGDANADISNAPPVNIYLTASYSSTGGARQINISAALHYTATQSDTDKLSVFLTEDSIITAQLLADGSVDTFYRNDHIMRAAVSNALGDIISVPSFVAGRVAILNYSYTIPPTDAVWNPANMNVIAFVHQYQHSNNVLQAQQIQLFPHHN